MLAKSFLDEGRLSTMNNLADLARQVFPDTYSSGDFEGSNNKLTDFETDIASRTLGDIIRLLKSFDKAPPFLLRIFANYQYADLKSVLRAYMAGDEKLPALASDNAEYRKFLQTAGVASLDFTHYPRLDTMLAKSEFAWVAKELDGLPFGSNAVLESILEKLDAQYYQLLWQDMAAERAEDTKRIKEIIRREIIFQNIECAMRLRSYYSYTDDEIRAFFINLPKSKNDDPARQAEATLGFALDHAGDWSGWKYASLLNKEQPGVFWRLDPRYFRNRASVYLYNLARKDFHSEPFRLDTAAIFIKLKQFEEQLLCSIAEGLRLGMKPQEVLTSLGLAANAGPAGQGG
jgi:vacuolar-type H+-ATPase subunit C/Vma6